MKKISQLIISMLCISALVFTAGCSDDDEIVKDFYTFEVSDSNYTFSPDGGEFTLTVTTDLEAGWKAEIVTDDAEWLTETARTTNSITYSAEENPYFLTRTAEVKLTAGTSVRKVVFSQGVSQIKKETGLCVLPGAVEVISPSGKYIVYGDVYYEGDTQHVDIYTFDTDTYKSELLWATTESIDGIFAISDTKVLVTGLASGGLSDGKIVENGVLKSLPLPAGLKNPAYSDISADGTVVIGYAQADGGWDYTPIRWTNGVPELLEIPTESRGYANPVSSAFGRVVSPDGKYTFGGLEGGSDAIYWEAGSTQWKFLGPVEERETEMELWTGELVPIDYYCFIQMGARSAGNFSTDGRYMGVVYSGWGKSRWGTYTYSIPFPALYDIQNHELVVNLEDYELENGTARGVGTDGRLFYEEDIWAYPSYGMYHDGTLSAADEWVNNIAGFFLGQGIQIIKYREEPTLLIGTYDAGGVDVPFVYSETAIATLDSSEE